MSPTERLNAAAAKIDRLHGQSATPWVAGSSYIGYEAGECTCYGGHLPQGHEPHCGIDGPVASDLTPLDAELAATAVNAMPAVAAWLRDMAVFATPFHDPALEAALPVSPALLEPALALADQILGGQR